MKIPSKIDSPEHAARADRARSTQAKKPTGPRGQGATAQPAAAATTQVSAKARVLANESDIDAEKVSRLRELIDQGAFEMDFMLIAERIVASGG